VEIVIFSGDLKVKFIFSSCDWEFLWVWIRAKGKPGNLVQGKESSNLLPKLTMFVIDDMMEI
jgi:hypothetical protein